MNHKLISLLAAAGLLVASIILVGIRQTIQVPRYHQHLEQPGEAELGVCETCDGRSSLCTHLPIIRIETGGQTIPGAVILNEEYLVTGYETGRNGEEMIQVSLSTVEAENAWHHGDDPANQTVSAMIRFRGNTSRAFSKHNYLIKLVDASDPLKNEAASLLGMSPDNEWALHGPFLDKTLLRNYMWMNLSAEVMGNAPDVRFCELLVDGEYQGVYVLMETISEGPGRVDLTDYTPGDAVCSYIVRIGGHFDPEKTIVTFNERTFRMAAEKDIEIVYPTRRNQTPQVHDYINADLSEIERLLVSFHMNDSSHLYRAYLDVDSFVNYYILQEFLANSDAFSESTYFYRDVRGKLHIGPVWDHNNSFDNFIRPIDMQAFIASQTEWYRQLMKDAQFVDRVISRYRQLRRTVLSEQRLNAYLDDTIAWLGKAVERNYRVWGYSFDISQVSPVERRQASLEDMLALEEQLALERASNEENLRRTLQTIRPYNPQSYEEAVDWLRSAMNARGAWLDAHIESLRQYCASSKNATRLDH